MARHLSYEAETVLVVDDDEAIRELEVRILRCDILGDESPAYLESV